MTTSFNNTNSALLFTVALHTVTYKRW